MQANSSGNVRVFPAIVAHYAALQGQLKNLTTYAANVTDVLTLLVPITKLASAPKWLQRVYTVVDKVNKVNAAANLTVNNSGLKDIPEVREVLDEFNKVTIGLNVANLAVGISRNVVTKFITASEKAAAKKALIEAANNGNPTAKAILEAEEEFKRYGKAKTGKDDWWKEGLQGAGSLDDLVSWASKNGLGNLTRTELDDIFKFVDNNFDFAKRVATSTKEIQSATTLTELAGKLNLPIVPVTKSLTPYQARVWYSWRKAKIGDVIDKTQTLENQAKQAFNMRNQIRTDARNIMKDTDIANYLDAKELNMTWQDAIQGKIDKGFSGNDIYTEIINSSMKGRPTIDNVFKIPALK